MSAKSSFLSLLLVVNTAVCDVAVTQQQVAESKSKCYFSEDLLAKYGTGAAEDHWILEWSVDTPKPVRVWRGEGYNSRISQSPSGMIAFTELLHTPENAKTPFLQRLRVFSAGPDVRKEVVCLDDVWEFSWSPDGKRIAYCTGAFSEKSDWGYSGSGLWILDLATHEQVKVAEKSYNPFWAGFDTSVYYVSEEVAPVRVKRYDPASCKTENTHYWSTRFSGNGRYYYYDPGDSTPFSLYVRETNAELSIRDLDGKVSPMLGKRFTAVGWVGDNYLRGYARATWNPPVSFFIEFPSLKLKKCPEPVVCTIGNDSAVVILPDKSLGLRKIADMPIVKLDQLPKAPDEEE